MWVWLIACICEAHVGGWECYGSLSAMFQLIYATMLLILGTFANGRRFELTEGAVLLHLLKFVQSRA